MKNALDLAQAVLRDSDGQVVHSRDWDVLRENRATIAPWASAFGKIYAESLFAGLGECDDFFLAERQQSFASWYEALVSGSPTPVFWAETGLLGLDHAVVGVQRGQVMDMGNCVDREFLERALANLDPRLALDVYAAFSRVFGIAVAVMVDGYDEALLGHMVDTGMNDGPFRRSRTLPVHPFIDQSRDVPPPFEAQNPFSDSVPSGEEERRRLVSMLSAVSDPAALAKSSAGLGPALGPWAEPTGVGRAPCATEPVWSLRRVRSASAERRASQFSLHGPKRPQAWHRLPIRARFERARSRAKAERKSQ